MVPAFSFSEEAIMFFIPNEKPDLSANDVSGAI
jgi:hypothetical protein